MTSVLQAQINILHYYSDYRKENNITFFKVNPVNRDIFILNCQIPGPKNTVWEKGEFTLQLSFPKNFPESPPEAVFIPAIFHPNVYDKGRLSLDILDQNKWDRKTKMGDILVSAQKLLAEPDIDSAVNNNAKEAYLKYKQNESNDEYAKKAKDSVEESLNKTQQGNRSANASACGSSTNNFGSGLISAGSFGFGSTNTRTFESGSTNTHTFGSGSTNTHTFGSGSTNTHTFGSGSTNTHTFESGSTNTHTFGSGSTNTHTFGSGSTNTHTSGSGSTNTRTFGSGSTNTRTFESKSDQNNNNLNLKSNNAATPSNQQSKKPSEKLATNSIVPDNTGTSNLVKQTRQFINSNRFVMFNQANASIIENIAKEQNLNTIEQNASNYQKYLNSIKTRLIKSFQFGELTATELIVLGLNKQTIGSSVDSAKILISSNPYSLTPPLSLIKQLGRALISAIYIRINDHDVILQFIKELKSDVLDKYIREQLTNQIRSFTEDQRNEIPSSIINFFNSIGKIDDNESPYHDSFIKDDINLLNTALLKSSSGDDITKIKVDLSPNEQLIFPKKIHTHKQSSKEKTDKPTLLEYAAFYGSEKCFNYLYHEKNCKITKNITKYALCGGNDQIYEIILKSGKSFIADLEYAIKFHHTELFKKVFLSYYSNDYGTDGTAYDVVQKKFSILCIRFFSFQILRFLIEFGVDVNDCMINIALENDIHSLFLFLLGLNVNVNKQDSKGNTTIHSAIKAENAAAIQTLLANKKLNVDLSLKDHDGKTPMQCAESILMGKSFQNNINAWFK